MTLKTRIIQLLLIIMLLPAISFSQSKSEKVKSRLVELFNLCKNDNYSDAASYIVYRGNDESRKWKDFCSNNNEEEMKEVIQVCKRIKSYVETGGNYNFVSFQTEKESEGEWCIWEVSFGNVEGKNAYFAFLKIKGKYCLGDID